MNTGVTLISPRLIDSDFEKLQNDDLREVEASSVLVNLDNVVKNVNQEKIAIHNRESNQLELIPQVSHQLVELSHLKVTMPTLEPSLSIRNVYPSVLEDWPSASMRFNSSQCLECVNGKQSTHHVFDRLCERRNKLNQHKKLNLSPKSWMFKYKRKHGRFVSFGEATARKHRNRVVTIHQAFPASLIRKILHTEENKLVLEQLGDTLCDDDRVMLQSDIEATVSKSEAILRHLATSAIKVTKIVPTSHKIHDRDMENRPDYMLERILERMKRDIHIMHLTPFAGYKSGETKSEMMQVVCVFSFQVRCICTKFCMLKCHKKLYFSVWHRWRKKKLQKTFSEPATTLWYGELMCVQQLYHGNIDCLHLFLSSLLLHSLRTSCFERGEY
ncbi:PREDICTED: uncharacterized protein LOC104731874 isoform X1 [Camelina sativa]|uniref:Uncharacterized protein LOC104731874 isoform X1 n=1 Tax=Camelina sativa TaxID=90675 RepID=A0ABM0V249_CAMSA|nr:PREDICTED: uncharacterized protein LOC104731874 isoform X1 [Camelina sativa]XP_010449681.1 PREDICTED: uncharacterized protein LOC104731874 isoform X1 [Camelina sativa]XP_019089664.1 PREDICTED: uncharacterized protein LOC104731874 isoform X1 [Camelina sativa]